MSDLAADMPSYLRRNQKETPMPAPTQIPAPKAPRQKRTDAFVVNLKVTIALDMSDAETLVAAMKAVDDAKAESSWPAGSVIECESKLAKV
jgi:hypothetical protein